MRNIKIFLLFSRSAIKSSLQAKTGVIFFTVGKILRFVLMFWFVFFLVSKTKTLKGYTVNQAIIFYLTFSIIDTLTQFLFREVYRFRSLIVSGDFDTILVKPYHPFLRVLIGGVDIFDAVALIPYTTVAFLFITKEISLTPSLLFAYIVLIINGVLIATAFHIAVLALGILTTQVDHAVMIYRDLTSVARFPLEIYREPVRFIFTFIIPIGIMMSYPSKALFGLLSPAAIIIALIFCAVSLFLSLTLWSRALKKYQSWGG